MVEISCIVVTLDFPHSKYQIVVVQALFGDPNKLGCLN